MFGKNKTYKLKYFENQEKLSIKSIFYTIQGEGPFSGQPAVFIRLAHCSLKCHFCDTDFDNDVVLMSIDEVYNEVLKISSDHCKLIVITGGEPLLQPLLADLMERLTATRFKIQIETSGSVCSPEIIRYLAYSRYVTIICSPKTSKINNELMTYVTAYKYVLSQDNVDLETGLPKGIYTNKGIPRPTYISPMDEYNDEKNKLNIQLCRDLCLKFGYILSLQIHKIIGVE